MMELLPDSSSRDDDFSWLRRVDEAIDELSQALISPLPVEKISELVLHHAKHLTDSRYGYVGYIQRETGHLICPTMTRDVWDECSVVDKDVVFDSFSGMWGWVLDNKEPILANDPRSDPRSTGVPSGHIPIRRFISVPAVFDDELVGQISLANSSRDYTDRDLDALERLASTYALAINRKMSNEALERAKNELLAIFNHAPILMVLLDGDVRVRMINDSGRRAHGLAEDEAVGKRAGEALNCINALRDPRGCGFGDQCGECRVRETVQRTFETGKAFERVTATLPLSGDGSDVESRDLLVSSSLLQVDGEERVLVSLEDVTDLRRSRDSLRLAHQEMEGKVEERTRRLSALSRDLAAEVEERQRVEVLLRESEKLYREMFQKNDAVKLLINPDDGSIINANAAAASFYGHPRCDLLRMNVRQINTADPEVIKEKMRRVVSGDQNLFVFEHRLASGDIRSVEVHSTLLRIDGKPILYSIIFDITDRLATEWALENAFSELDQVFQNVDSGMLILDLDNNIVKVNDTLAKMTGLSKEKMLESKCHEIFPGDACPTDECTLKRVMNGENVPPVEMRKTGPRGEPRIYQVSAKPFRASDGRLVGIFQEYRDMTQQKRLESIAEAVNTMNNISYVFSGIRHELGNPVNSIKTTLSVLRQKLDRFDQERTESYLERALADLSRVEYLLLSLKNFSMYETPKSTHLLLATFLENFRKLIEDDLTRKRVKLELCLPTDPIWIRADPRALQQAMLNLVTNALDALDGASSERGPSVVIDATLRGKVVDISVEDNGKGMSDAQLENVFKPFYTNKPKGTGLGLVIARKMVRGMEGTVDIESRLGRGTRVTLGMPVCGDRPDA